MFIYVQSWKHLFTKVVQIAARYLLLTWRPAEKWWGAGRLFLCLRFFGYMGMWHVTQKVILLVVLFLIEITQGGGGQGGTHKLCVWGKSILPAGSYLVWEGGLHGDLYAVITGAGIGRWARRRIPLTYAPNHWLIEDNLPSLVPGGFALQCLVDADDSTVWLIPLTGECESTVVCICCSFRHQLEEVIEVNVPL